MENIIDRFIETMKNASQSEVNNLLNNSNNELSKDGYIFFKNPNVFKNLPVGVIQETSHILRFVFKTDPNTKERFYELNNIIYDLAQWVDNLK